MADRSTIGKLLRLAREAKGLTQDALAEKTAISQAAISRIEQGITEDPGVLLLSKLAAALGQPVEVLVPTGDLPSIARPQSLADLFRPYELKRIAEHVGVSMKTVDAWKRGRMDLFYAYIAPLTTFLGIDRDRLIDACVATTGRPPVGP